MLKWFRGKYSYDGDIVYLTSNHLIRLNMIAIRMFDVKKADKHEVLSRIKLDDVIEVHEDAIGDIYDKAVVLIKELTRKHVFASGNRRTAMLSAILFLTINDAKVFIADTPINSKTMTGIREDYYSDKEIRGWFKNGKIKEFRRFG